MYKFLVYLNGYICYQEKNILYISSKMYYKYFFLIIVNKFFYLFLIVGVVMYRSKLMVYQGDILKSSDFI